MAPHNPVSGAPKRQTKLLLAGLTVLVAVVIGFVIIRSQAATSKPGDLDGDGKVTQADISLLSKNINRKNVTAAEGDMDGDSDVDITDLSIATTKIE